MSRNLLPRVCRSCDCTFTGGPRAWYCPSCRADRSKVAQKRHRENKAAGKTIPLGSLIVCEICGKEIIKKCGMQKYCPSCAAVHLKTVDNRQSLDWKRSHPDRVRELQLEFRKRKRENAEMRQSGVKYIYWDKEHSKWKVQPIVNGKQINIGRFGDLEEAKQILNCYLSKRGYHPIQ